jgi:ribosome biogenesis GTPase
VRWSHHLLSKGIDVQLLLSSLGWDEFFESEFAPYDGYGVPARVVRADRGAVDVLTADNPVRVALASNDRQPAVGDWVVLAPGADRQWAVDAVLARRSAISRASATGDSAAQVIAANVDVVLVVVPAVPEPRIAMTERLVALAWDSGATPVVVVTKADLADDRDVVARDLAEAAPGVHVTCASATEPAGLEPLRAQIVAGRTYCMIGRSGAGKSTLANALLDRGHFTTQDIRADGKGRHTTSHRELVVLPDGGLLIDTPGLRGVGLWIGDDGIERAFADVEALIAECRFSDCAHHTEPGCAVLEAVADGRLARRRLDSWRKLQREARWMASRHDARLRAEDRQRWKAIHLEARRSGRTRP